MTNEYHVITSNKCSSNFFLSATHTRHGHVFITVTFHNGTTVTSDFSPKEILFFKVLERTSSQFTFCKLKIVLYLTVA